MAIRAYVGAPEHATVSFKFGVVKYLDNVDPDDGPILLKDDENHPYAKTQTMITSSTVNY